MAQNPILDELRKMSPQQTPEEPAEEAPQDVGTARKLAAMGIRVVSPFAGKLLGLAGGAIGATGGTVAAPGPGTALGALGGYSLGSAVGSGAGEALAEVVEGSPLSASKIGLETVLGGTGIPFISKAKRGLTAIGLGAGTIHAGNVARHLVDGQSIGEAVKPQGWMEWASPVLGGGMAKYVHGAEKAKAAKAGAAAPAPAPAAEPMRDPHPKDVEIILRKLQKKVPLLPKEKEIYTHLDKKVRDSYPKDTYMASDQVRSAVEIANDQEAARLKSIDDQTVANMEAWLAKQKEIKAKNEAAELDKLTKGAKPRKTSIRRSGKDSAGNNVSTTFVTAEDAAAEEAARLAADEKSKGAVPKKTTIRQTETDSQGRQISTTLQTAEDAEKEAARLQAIRDAQDGKVPVVSTSETITAETPEGGKASKTTKFVDPPEENPDGEDISTVERLFKANTPAPPKPAPAAPVKLPDAPQEPSAPETPTAPPKRPEQVQLESLTEDLKKADPGSKRAKDIQKAIKRLNDAGHYLPEEAPKAPPQTETPAPTAPEAPKVASPKEVTAQARGIQAEVSSQIQKELDNLRNGEPGGEHVVITLPSGGTYKIVRSERALQEVLKRLARPGLQNSQVSQNPAVIDPLKKVGVKGEELWTDIAKDKLASAEVPPEAPQTPPKGGLRVGKGKAPATPKEPAVEAPSAPEGAPTEPTAAADTPAPTPKAPEPVTTETPEQPKAAPASKFGSTREERVSKLLEGVPEEQLTPELRQQADELAAAGEAYEAAKAASEADPGNVKLQAAKSAAGGSAQVLNRAFQKIVKGLKPAVAAPEGAPAKGGLKVQPIEEPTSVGSSMDPNKPLLTYQDLVDKYKISLRNLERAVRSKNLEGIRFGRSIRFHPDEVERWLKAGGVSGGRQAGFSTVDAMMRIASAGAGAHVGAQQDQEHPLRGALLGGAAGFVAPSVAKGVYNAATSGNVKENLKKAWEETPNIYRFNLLSAPESLAPNVAAPYGSGVMASIEKLLSGDRRALEVLESYADPQKNFAGLGEAWNEARQRILSNERADMTSGGFGGMTDEALALPGTMMTTSDVAVQNKFKNAGFSDDVSREVTMTSEPYTSFGKAPLNFVRGGGTIAKLMLPFSRTAANIVEQGLERVPGVGIAMEMAKPENMRASKLGMGVKQGMGVGVFLIAKKIGENVDPSNPESVRQAQKWISNMAGQYSMIASAGFAAGQAELAGKNPHETWVENNVGDPSTIAKSILSDFPLPATRAPLDIIDSGIGIATQKPAHPDLPFPSNYLPRAVVPGFVRSAESEQAQAADEFLRRLLGQTSQEEEQ